MSRFLSFLLALSFFLGALFMINSTNAPQALYVCDPGETLSYDSLGNAVCVGTPQYTGFLSSGAMIKVVTGARNVAYGENGLRLYGTTTNMLRTDYFSSLGDDSIKGIINNIGIKRDGSFSTEADGSWYGFSKCVDVPEDGEYIVAGAGDNGLRVTLDGITIMTNETTNGNAYKSYWMYPIYLPAGGHLIEYQYKWAQTSEMFAGQLVGPFPRGSMIDYANHALYPYYQISNLIGDAGQKTVTLARYNQTVQAPTNWVDNVVWSSDSELGQNAIIGPGGGFTCEPGYVPNVVEGGLGSNACGNHGCLKVNVTAATYIDTTPTIVITAPTKVASGDIVDTTIRVTGTGVYATGVSIDTVLSTASPTNLVCTDTTPGEQVDCTVTIRQSGKIWVNATSIDDLGSAEEAGYIIDKISPIINITNNVNPAQNSGDEVRATISDNYCLQTGSVAYGFSNDALCNSSDTYNIPYTSDDIIGLYDTSNNGKYICFVATDCLGNTTYQATTGPINVAPALVIQITAPTKGSSGDIVDTTIRVTGTGLSASGVSIDTVLSTASPTNLACTDTTPGSQVDCTITIRQTGNLKINAVSVFNSGSATEPNYIIDKVKPVITIVDNVDTTLNSGDTIVVGVTDNIQLMTGGTTYGFNTTATCDATSTYDTPYASGTNIIINNDMHNGKYICFKAIDWVGNTSYLPSAGPINVVGSGINISIVAPTKKSQKSITDTTIRVLGRGIYATGVSIAPGTTIDPTGLICKNTVPGVQVDCTIVIQQSGILKIAATNGSASVTGEEPNYVIDKKAGYAGGGGTITPVTPVTPPIAPPVKVGESCFTPNNQKITYQGNKVSDLFLQAHQMLYNYEVTQYRGTADYRPGQYLLRQEAARFMTEFAENVLCRKKYKKYNNNFTDITGVDPTLKPYIIDSYEYGIFKGDGSGAQTTFRPKDIITKNELSAILIRLITNEFYAETTKGDWSKMYRGELDNYLRGVALSSVSRGNVAEVIYSLYKDNDYVLRDIGYVVK